MGRIISRCGLICSECPAYTATQENDEEKRKNLAQSWTSEEYAIEPEDINCDGCTGISGKLFKFCKECEIRSCSLEKNIKNCAYCPDYPCDKLNQHFEKSVESKTTLDRIRKNR